MVDAVQTLDLRKAADVRLVMRAERERWPVSETIRQFAVGQALQIARDPTSGKREVLRALELLEKMVRGNNAGTDPETAPSQEERVEPLRRLALAAARRKFGRRPALAAGGGDR